MPIFSFTPIPSRLILPPPPAHHTIISFCLAAYSEAFYRNVTGDVGVGVLVRDWIAAHEGVFGPASKAEVQRYFPERAEEIVDLMRSLQEQGKSMRMFSQILGIGNVMLRFNVNHADFTAALLERTDPYLAVVDADQAGRHAAFTGPAIHLQLANVTTSFLSATDGPARRVLNASTLSAAKQPLYPPFMNTPMQFVISASPAESGFKALSSLQGFYQSDGSRPPVPVSPPFGGRTPKLSQVAAISSAFIGMLGSPASSTSFIDIELGQLPADTLDATMCGQLSRLMDATYGPQLAAACPAPPAPVNTQQVVSRLKCAIRTAPLFLAEMSVCDQPLDEAGACPYPATRLMDGGYVDNVAAAQTLAAMQAQVKGGPVRMILSTDQECDRPPDKPQDGSAPWEGNTCSLFDLAALFTGGYNGTVAPGDPVTISWGATQPSSIVFAAEWSSVNFTKAPGSAPDGGGGGAFTATVRTTTVANAAFGVAAGTQVDLLLIAANLPVGGWFHPQDFAAIEAYAGAIGESTLDEVIRAWYASA